MTDGLLAILAVGLVLGGLVYNVVLLRRLAKVWRGETLASLPVNTLRGPQVNHRSYPLFAVWYTLFVPGLGLGLLAGSVHLTTLAVVGILMAMAAVLLVFPLWLLVNATNKPRFLVPPAWRSEQGWWGEWRDRRARTRAGQPPETHPVEVLDVRPLPGDPDNQFPPYFVARCADDDCDWMSHIVDASESDAEGRVRREAGTHSPHVSGPRRPLG